jgi:hypothetical protein
MTQNVLRLDNWQQFEALKNRAKGKPVKPSKFHAVQTEMAGIKFSTKKEAKYYQELQARKHMGEIKYILRQVPFDLPGHFENGRVIRHFVDFAICLPDGTFQFIEVKGRDLALGKMKRLQVEEIYGTKIVVV